MARRRNTLADDTAALLELLRQRENLLRQRDIQLNEHQAQLARRDQALAARDAALAARDAELAARDQALAARDAELAEQQQTIAELRRFNDALSHRLHLALRRVYGRMSERVDASQLLLFGELLGQAAAVIEKASAPPEAVGRPARRAKGHGRQTLPDDLPRHRLEHPVTPEELSCPCCNGARVRIGEEISEQLDYAPASLFVVQHVRPKYACPHCEKGGVVTAERSSAGVVIAKGLPGPGLVAQVIVSKFCDHLPLHRQEAIFARHGVHLARSTQCGWCRGAADLLTPLVELMAREVRASRVIHTDDTPMPVQAKGRGRTRTGRLWVYLGDHEHPYITYEYTPSRRRDGPARWLENFKGYLQADAFGGYDGIYASREILEVACWAHARRKFHEARGSDPQRSHRALALIRLLYDVERDASELDAQGRMRMRQERSAPRLLELHGWLEQEREAVLPRSPLGSAISYALHNWEALTRYSTDGDLSIDNNAAERAIRPLAVGRKNYLFFGSDAGGRSGAVLYSVVASAQRHGLDPFVYLRDVLTTIGSTPLSKLEQYLPDRWKARQLQELAAD